MENEKHEDSVLCSNIPESSDIVVEIHVDSLAGFEQPHLHVEFHQKVIEPWVGVESEHIA